MATGTIGGRLRLERERLGMTQAELARLGGVGRQTQWRFEEGSRTPDADYLARISKAGVNVLYVLNGKRQ
jgi:transcriptional regulator with XRE-family HTH domain